jgi:hypothetical protein
MYDSLIVKNYSKLCRSLPVGSEENRRIGQEKMLPFELTGFWAL